MQSVTTWELARNKPGKEDRGQRRKGRVCMPRNWDLILLIVGDFKQVRDWIKSASMFNFLPMTLQKKMCYHQQSMLADGRNKSEMNPYPAFPFP